MNHRVRRILAAAFVLVSLVAGPARAQAPQLPPGVYLLEFAVFSDDCGHDPFIADLPEAILIEIDPETGELVMSGPEPWVEVRAAVGDDGSVNGAGLGVVAGLQAVSIVLEGEVVAPGVIEGLLAYGAGGELPGDCPIIWRLSLISEEPAPVTSTTTSTTTTTSSPATTTSTSTTTTIPVVPTTAPPETTPTTTTPDTSGGGGFPWWILLGAGGALVLLGLLLLARKKDCEEEMRAWLAAQQACEEARAAEEKAKERRDDAEEKRDGLEDGLEDLCEGFPPACEEGDPRDSWAEDPSRPGSRIDRLDLHAGRVWARKLWGDYRNGDLTARQLEETWGEPPPPDFVEDIRARYEKEKAEHDRLERDLEESEGALAAAEKDLAKAGEDRRRACEEAAAARRRLDECLQKATPAPAGGAPGGGAGPEGPEGPGGPTGTAGGGGEPSRCPDGEERDGSSRTAHFAIPVDFRPIIGGGEAHTAAEEGRRLADGLKQVEIVTTALGRLFAFAPGATLATEFTTEGAASLGSAVVSEATGIPIPTSIPEAAANYATILAKAAGAIIEAVPGWQERRLPDVDLGFSSKLAHFTLTCTDVERCRDGKWVRVKRRLTMERSADTAGPARPQVGGFTWAEAQEQIRVFANRFAAGQRRALEAMGRFRDDCRAG